ncbi:MAG: redoxin family protein [Candidatus Velthaea sp.]
MMAQFVRASLAVLLAAVWIVAARADAPTAGGPHVGAPAPPFALTTVDGRSVTLDAFKGKTLVINAWATWCPPCREETPDLIAAYKALHAGGVVFLGVDSTEQAPIVRAFTAAKGVPYAQAIDAERTFSRAYDIRYFPTTFVIDPHGVLRARYIDVITPRQLSAFVASAQAGRDGTIASALQTKIDALLAPEGFSFAADSAALGADVKRASDAIARADELVDESDPAKGRIVDLIRVRGEQAELRDRAIAALAGAAATSEERTLLAQLQGDVALERHDWSDALARYDAALAIDTADRAALQGVASAAAGAKQYERAVAADRRLSELAPSIDAFMELGNAYKGAGDFPRGAAAYDRAVALATSAVNAHRSDAKAIRRLAFVHLQQGRLYAAAGDRANARAAFAAVTAWTLRLPKNDARYAMFLEEAQEATVALDLDLKGGVQTTVSLAPWTGPDLPGSIASTVKYRLVVGAPPGRTVTLAAAGLPKGWIASFCTDRVCAPFRLATLMPPSGVKVIEFQVVPDGPSRPVHLTIRVDARAGASHASAGVTLPKGP